MIINYKKITELSIEEAVNLWNSGFEGYFVNMKMTVNSFLTRAVNEGLSLDHSVAAYLNGQPVGFVVNGFRSIGGKQVAWNGGTGIVPEFRGKGIGKRLMTRNLELYHDQGVELALLEALSENEQAIKLYKSSGYEIIDRMTILQNMEPLSPTILQIPSQTSYSIKKGLPGDIASLPFYRQLSPWQTQWPSIKDGESVLVLNDNKPVGYALFKRILDQEGQLTATSLYQCEALPNLSDEEEILKAALQEVYQPLELAGKRMTGNLRASNRLLINLLQKLGFTTLAEQVHMAHTMER
jgi:GNAT superfamily N-acetyltransferase